MSKKRILIFNPEPERLLQALGAASHDAEFLLAHNRDHAMELAARADALFAPSPYIDQDLIDAVGNLQWVQVLTSGIDAFADTHMPTRPILTTVRGIHGPQVAELAVLMMLALKRRLPDMLEDQRLGLWRRWRQPLLTGSKIVLLGTGAIARETARCCKALGTTIVGVTRTVRTIPCFDQVVGYDRFTASLADADVLILLCPLTDDTRDLVDAKVLAALPSHAILLNLARGGVLDEAAARDALVRGALAGIGLDAYSEEPPPAKFPLRPMRNAILTPHIGGFSANYEEQMSTILLHNLNCFLSEKFSIMKNIVT